MHDRVTIVISFFLKDLMCELPRPWNERTSILQSAGFNLYLNQLGFRTWRSMPKWRSSTLWSLPELMSIPKLSEDIEFWRNIWQHACVDDEVQTWGSPNFEKRGNRWAQNLVRCVLMPRLRSQVKEAWFFHCFKFDLLDALRIQVVV